MQRNSQRQKRKTQKPRNKEQWSPTKSNEAQEPRKQDRSRTQNYTNYLTKGFKLTSIKRFGEKVGILTLSRNILKTHNQKQHSILFKFFHNVKHVQNQERDIIIHVILKKNKTRHKIKYFCRFENFQCFWIFFFKKTT